MLVGLPVQDLPPEGTLYEKATGPLLRGTQIEQLQRFLSLGALRYRRDWYRRLVWQWHRGRPAGLSGGPPVAGRILAGLMRNPAPYAKNLAPKTRSIVVGAETEELSWPPETVRRLSDYRLGLSALKCSNTVLFRIRALCLQAGPAPG